MSISEVIPKLSIKRNLTFGETFRTEDEYVLGYTSLTFNIISVKSVKFKVYAGKRNTNPSENYPPLIIEKTLDSNTIYSRTIDVINNYLHIEIENESATEDAFVKLDTLGSFTRSPNSLVRQHREVDATNNINLTKEGSTFLIDLSRGLLENQKVTDIYGSTGGLCSTPNVLWDDTNNDVFDGLSIGVSCQIQSSSVLDVLGAVGGVCVKVTGLISDFSEAEEVIQLNGVTPVTLGTEFMRVNQAEVTLAGTGLLNQGDIEISPIYDTSLILERISAQKGKSATFHYTVPKDEELIVTELEINTAIQDPALFNFSVVDCESPGVSGGGTPILKKSLKYGGIHNGEAMINIEETFTTGQTIKLDVSTNSGLPLGLNTIHATARGARINTIL